MIFLSEKGVSNDTPSRSRYFRQEFVTVYSQKDEQADKMAGRGLVAKAAKTGGDPKRTARPRHPRSAQAPDRGGGIVRLGSNKGIEKWNCEPRPTSLSTHNRPPCTSTRCLAMAKPRPVPPASRERAASTR